MTANESEGTFPANPTQRKIYLTNDRNAAFVAGACEKEVFPEREGMSGDGGKNAGMDQVGADEEEKRDEAMEADFSKGTADFFAEKKKIAAEKTDGT